MASKFWYSENQRRHVEYIDSMPGFMPDKPSPPKGSPYAVIDGMLVKYTEAYSSGDPDYAPNFDDAVFLGYGEYACHDWNIQRYLKQHPEVKLVDDEWPEFIG